MVSVKRLWYHLTEPSPLLQSADERRQARLVAGMFLLCSVVGFLCELYVLFFLPEIAEQRSRWSILFGIFILFICYLFSRTPHYHRASELGLITGNSTFFYLLIQQNEGRLAMMIFGLAIVLLASLLFSQRSTIVLIAANTLGCLAVAWLFPLPHPFQQLFLLTLGAYVIVAGLIVLSVWHRRLLEQDRQAVVRASEARLRALMDALPDMVAHLSAQGELLSVRIPEHFGVHNGYAVRPPGPALAEELRARLESGVQQALQGHELKTQEFDLPLAGRVLTCEARFSRLNSQEVLAAIRDITERKQAEAQNMQLLREVSEHREQLRQLAQRLSEVQEAERRRLANELHDQVGQNLGALGLNLSIIRSQVRNLCTEESSLVKRLTDSMELVEQITERIRNVMSELRPMVLDDYGLVDGLEWYAGRLAVRSGLRTHVSQEGILPELPDTVVNGLFRIAQEALANVVRHAEAQQVTIQIEGDPGQVCMTITDDGCGFQPRRGSRESGENGWGLLIMQERAVAIGGQVEIRSTPGHGTQVKVTIPLKGEHP
ncbi:MAG: hypothetical protein KatS3mg050_1823 [Litorilinea sp.]|nr:MAG: hypothetical protein KatS3mg050_1823 [Litorilinea sp.]